MGCYICGTPAQPIVCSAFNEYPCPNCGRYRISTTAMVLFEMNKWTFNVPSARRWIASEIRWGETPLIDSQRAVFLT
jgi:predicted RNA-binding Zn-ribbon protein involved in translation (DUF1610 family)